MKKIFFVYLSLLPGFLYCEPYTLNKDTEKIYQDIKAVADITDNTVMWKKIAEETPSRLDIAVFLNQCFIDSEKNKIQIPEDISSELLKEFDREFLILDLQNRIDRQNEHINKLGQTVDWNLEFSFAGEQISGDFPLTEREITLYGVPPPSSVISFSQQMRLGLTAGTDKLNGFCILKNFGYWGIGKYSSGSSGIDFSSSDPPQIEQVAFRMANNFSSIEIGRRYLRLGKYGLSVDYLISPLEAIQLTGKWKDVSLEGLVGSRVDSADYYASRIGLGSKKFALGVIGFASVIKKDYITQYNLTNDKGLGGDIKFNFYRGREIAGEYSYYKPQNADGINSWVCSVDLVNNNNFGFLVIYADIGEIPRQTIAMNQLPLEFVDEKFLRFEQNSKGPNIFVRVALPHNIVAKYEFLYLDTSEDILKRHAIRFGKKISNWDFIISDLYTIDDLSGYNTAQLQLTVSF